MIGQTTIPGSPLPAVRHLLGAFKASGFSGDRWIRGRTEFVLRLYGRGIMALSFGIDAVRKASGEDKAVVWVPDFFCNEALDLLRLMQVIIKYYPIDKGLKPDWQFIGEKQAETAYPQVFILVHYFGIPNACQEAKTFCEKHKMVLLEDCAHVLIPSDGIGLGDIMMFSPHKLLAVPSGGILIITKEMEPYFEDEPVYPAEKGISRWVCSAMAKKVFVKLHIPWHVFMARQYNERWHKNQFDFKQADIFSSAPYTQKLLGIAEDEIEEVIIKRRTNYICLEGRLSGNPHVRPLYDSIGSDTCPYVFPLLAAGNAEKILTKLVSNGIPAVQWPDFPPEVLRNSKGHETAIKIHERLILLPVHQGLNKSQINRIGECLSGTLMEFS